MKKLILILLICAACSKLDLGYTVLEGDNVFNPVTPPLPFIGNTLEFDLTLGPEWFISPLSYPSANYGCKLYEVGGLKGYHYGGASFALISEENRMYILPYWYEDIDQQPYKLHSESGYRVEMFRYKLVHCMIAFTDSTRFYIDRKLIYTAPSLPHSRIDPPFFGRSGNDTGYAVNNPPAYAIRNLTLLISLY